MDEAVPIELQGLAKFFAIIAVGIGTFLITLDQFIVNVSISTIAGELGVSDNNGAWSITAYTTASAFVIPLTGFLTERIGRIRLFALSAILFAFFSFMCGAAMTLGQLVLYRVLQGAAGGPLIPLSQSLLLLLMPGRKSAALGVFGMLVMIGPVVGPILGGWITFDYGWRPIFYINVPIGILVAIVSYSLLARFESKKTKPHMDYWGLAFLFFWVAAYQILMNKGYDWAWFESYKIRVLGIITVICLVLFMIWEWFDKEPIVNLKFFKSFNFAAALFIMTPIMSVAFCNLVVGPLWVQNVLGYNQLWAGLTLAPMGLTSLIFFPLVGRFMPYMDVRLWVFFALTILSASFFWMAYSPIDIDFMTIAKQRMLMGVGFALIYPPLMAMAISDIPPKQMPSGTGLYSFARMMGVGFGVAYGANYYLTREVFFQSRYSSWMIPSNEFFAPYVTALEGLGMKGQEVNAMLYEVLQHQAFTESYLQLCFVSGVIAALLALALPFTKKVDLHESTPAGVGH
ncbi:MAG: Multidrug export protein EmrB [Chlamydiales bacterium]|nr:Multidrug export protein EmrB [Chlamydiales bacterium]MCH9635805.1 Multidrug export protein EmrB [Chlamydiales bacterium]MCH9703201.1 DHA2 family efflux MFS transporter permease subunit [Chlamydiota bacterium]